MTLAVLPVRVRGHGGGALTVTRDQDRGPYADEDLVLAQMCADLVGAALDGAALIADVASVQEDLRRQHEMVDHVSDAIIAVNGDHLVVSWNAAAERTYGYSAGEAFGCDLFALLATEFVGADGQQVDRDAALAETDRTGEWRGELRERRADGAEVEILTSIATLPDGTGGPNGLVFVNRDLTEQRRKEHLATHDTLTGLPNRALVRDLLRRAVADAERTGSRLAVLFLDLDGFKQVNDRLGHAAGDEVLRVTARRLQDAARGSDTVARLGGDEFLVVAPHVGGPDGAATLSRPIRS